MNDFRFAIRMLLKNPGFTAVAVVTLGLGIGAATAIFSLIHAVALRELPFGDADRLTILWADNPGLKMGLPVIPPANADVAEWRKQSQSFEKIAAFTPRTVDLSDAAGEPERVGAAAVTAGFFETLGVSPLMGRPLALDEEPPGGPPAALISYSLWQRRFGGDLALVGKPVTINGNRVNVVGIMPPGFEFPRGAEWPSFFPFSGRTEVWMPLAFSEPEWQSRDERGLVVLGRLKAGSSLRQAQAELDAFSARQAADHPDSHKGWIINVISLRRQMAGKSQPALLVLFAAVGALLLIACVNVANLLLTRGTARRQEMALRAALGAARGRLLRQMLTECLLLSALGSGLGMVVAEACLRAFLALNPSSRSLLDDASLDPAVLAFTVVVTLVTSLLSGLIPAIQASKYDLRGSLQEGGRGTEGPARGQLRHALVAVESGLAVMLLAASVLLVRSFLRVQGVNIGFQADSALAFDVQLPDAKYPTDGAKSLFFQQLTVRLEGIPGVRAAGGISYIPLGGGENLGSFTVEGSPPVVPGHEPAAERRQVTPGYFAALGIPIRAGRVFTQDDREGHPLVAVINETMVKQFFGGRDALGKRIQVGGAWRTVAGVAADVKSASLEAAILPQIYIPEYQWSWGGLTFVVQTEGNPEAVAPAARAQLKALDAAIPAANIRTMRQMVSNASSARRFNMALLGFFAAAALFLTAIGIYGVVAFSASRRSREIGVRIALGAKRNDVLELILRQGMKPVVIGGLAGVAGSFAVSRALESQLYEISRFDFVTLAIATGTVFAAALVACGIPARRAANLDPIAALRAE